MYLIGSTINNNKDDFTLKKRCYRYNSDNIAALSFFAYLPFDQDIPPKTLYYFDATFTNNGQ